MWRITSSETGYERQYSYFEITVYGVIETLSFYEGPPQHLPLQDLIANMPNHARIHRAGSDDPHKCSLLFRNGDDVVYFDIQRAEPGTFTVPGVVDLETYKPGTVAEFSWVYFKGDPQAGPQPGHPFDMPFDNHETEFAIDLVEVDNPSVVLQNIMRESSRQSRHRWDTLANTMLAAPTISRPFWQGGVPFGRRTNYSMAIPRLDRSCKYYAIGEMVYYWAVSEDLKSGVTYQLKLTTSDPASTFFSGDFQISAA